MLRDAPHALDQDTGAELAAKETHDLTNETDPGGYVSYLALLNA